jgi:hypothetical protein
MKVKAEGETPLQEILELKKIQLNSTFVRQQKTPNLSENENCNYVVSIQDFERTEKQDFNEAHAQLGINKFENFLDVLMAQHSSEDCNKRLSDESIKAMIRQLLTAGQIPPPSQWNGASPSCYDTLPWRQNSERSWIPW